MTDDQRENQKLIIAEGLAEFFKNDPKKIALWLLSDNPHFGNLPPAYLIGIRGEPGLEKVAKFILAAMELNAFP